MIAELMARWCATPCSLIFIPLGVMVSGWALWKAWQCFRRWDQRDPLALKKLTLAINVMALIVGTTAIVRLHLQAKLQPQPTAPTYPSGVTPDSPKSPPSASAPMLESQQNPSPDGGDAKAPEPPCDPRNEEPSAGRSSPVQHRRTSHGVESSLLWRDLSLVPADEVKRPKWSRHEPNKGQNKKWDRWRVTAKLNHANRYEDEPKYASKQESIHAENLPQLQRESLQNMVFGSIPKYANVATCIRNAHRADGDNRDEKQSEPLSGHKTMIAVNACAVEPSACSIYRDWHESLCELFLANRIYS